MRSLKFRLVAGFIAAAISIFIVWIWKGNSNVGITQIIVEDNVPDGFDGYKIAHISDFHNSNTGDKIIDRLKELGCDIIVMTGDMIDSRNTQIELAADFMNKAAEIVPCYYATGNHEARAKREYYMLKEMVKDKITILEGEDCTVESKGDSVKLIGMLDTGFELDAGAKKLVERVMPTGDEYKILLAHRPEYLDDYDGANLILSGHAHGGQFILPFIGGLFAPGQGLFPRFTQGLYEKNGKKMVVSRGLGNSLFPFRINNDPEIVLIELKKIW